jgi:Uma2 family endonuclease
MLPFKYPVPQTDPPRSPRETLPTMYDLPSEDPEEPGLPDEFHDLQPQLLSYTFRPPNYRASEIFSGTDMNLDYDVRHPMWHKRPDWSGVVGVPRLYDEIDLRMSYVFSRYTNRLRAFELEAGHYLELELSESRVWMSDLNLGLGLWQWEFQGIDRLWLRWYDIEGNWILTPEERERQRAEQAEAQLESLIQRLRESGIDPDAFLNS